MAQGYADAMIAHGRDRYGAAHSPLFATALDRRRLRMFGWWGTHRLLVQRCKNWGIRPFDRSIQGANPMQDQNLYRTLYALALATGQERYRAEADATLAWFFEHCQSPQTGLFAWGEHIGWDFRTETTIVKKGGMRHEFLRPWALWERSFALAPEPCERFAHGLWLHQIADHERCLFSRHARYDRHGPIPGNEFPRHGGFYIATWAAAYRYTADPAFLDYIERLVDSFEARRHPETDALMAETNTPELFWPYSSLGLAIDLGEAAAGLPDALGAKMRRCAERSTAVFLKVPHEPAARGFVRNAVTSTLEPGWKRVDSPKRQEKRRQGKRLKPREKKLYSETWDKSYGHATHAADAMLCHLRYRQTGIEGLARLVVQAAGRYLNEEPNATVHLHPGVLADAIALMLAAWETTHDERYLERGEALGRFAVATFFDGSPLPRVTSKVAHYEAITRGDSLAMQCLELWRARHCPEADLGLFWNDR